ncbi:hypothetical protein EDC96DRAFT_569661, partial [Choanephora cucurbitarum]
MKIAATRDLSEVSYRCSLSTDCQVDTGVEITITSLLAISKTRSYLIDPVGIYKMSHFSNKTNILLRGTRKTEDEVSEIKIHVEQLEARFKEHNQLEVTVLPACLITRPYIKDMHGDLNTPLNLLKYFLISCFADSINPNESINSTDRAKKEAMMKLHLSILEQLGKVVLADLLYHVQEKESELEVKTWTQIPLKYKLAAYDNFRYLDNVYRIPINRSRGNWLEGDIISYYFRNKKLDQLSSESKTGEGSNPAK